MAVMLMHFADITAKAVVLFALLVSAIWTAGLCYGAFKIIAAAI